MVELGTGGYYRGQNTGPDADIVKGSLWEFASRENKIRRRVYSVLNPLIIIITGWPSHLYVNSVCPKRDILQINSQIPIDKSMCDDRNYWYQWCGNKCYQNRYFWLHASLSYRVDIRIRNKLFSLNGLMKWCVLVILVIVLTLLNQACAQRRLASRTRQGLSFIAAVLFDRSNGEQSSCVSASDTPDRNLPGGNIQGFESPPCSSDSP